MRLMDWFLAESAIMHLNRYFASLFQVKALISKLTEEKNFAVQQRNKLQQELDLLRRESNRGRGGIPFMYVIIVGLLGLLLGYLLKRT